MYYVNDVMMIARCVRHLFKPVLKQGHSVLTAQVFVFLFSAFFHEYLISVPLGVFKWYAAFGMMMQVRGTNPL